MRTRLARLMVGAVIVTTAVTSAPAATAAELGIDLEHLYERSGVFEVVCVPDPPVNVIVRNDATRTVLGVKAISCVGNGTPQRVVVDFEVALTTGSVVDVSATVSGDSGEINGSWPGTTVETAPRTPPAANVPSSPRRPHATAGSGRATLYWAVPASTGGSPIDRYQVRRGRWLRNVSAAVRSYTFTGLRNGTRYALSVRAHNAVGFSVWTRAVPVRPHVPPRPRAYPTCAAMHRGMYPHGVGLPGARDRTSGTPVTTFVRSTVGYRMNDGRVRSRGQYDLDRDNDGIACER